MLTQNQEILLQGIIDGDYRNEGITLGEWAVNCSEAYSSAREIKEDLQRLNDLKVINYRVESAKNSGSSEDEIYVTDLGEVILQYYKVLRAIDKGSFSQSQICDEMPELQDYEVFTAVSKLRDLGLLECTEGAYYDGGRQFTDIWLTNDGLVALNKPNQWWAMRRSFAAKPEQDIAKVIQHFNGPVNGVVGVAEGDQNIYASPDQQTLVDVVTEILKYLKQLEQINPDATSVEKRAYASAAIPPNRRQRAVSALQSGGKAAIKEFLNNPYLNVAVAIIEGWQKAGIGA